MKCDLLKSYSLSSRDGCNSIEMMRKIFFFSQ